MKTKLSISALVLLALLSFQTQCPAFSLLGTGFTYQGRLNDGTGPANGVYDLQFTIYDSTDVPGTVIAGPITNAATVVSNGIFTVTVDFGTNVLNAFNLSGRWLEIEARTNGAVSFVTLAPRQQISPTPYAFAAVNAATLLGNLPASQVQGTLSLAQLPAGILTNNQTGVSLSGTFAGNGSGLTNVSASTIGGVGSNGFWQIAGNAGTTAGPNFIGTMDSQPLEIRVNNTRAFRIEPTPVPSVEGGYFQNSTHGFTSAAIVGGGTSGSINEVFGNYGFIGAGHGAKVGMFSAVVDGAYNDANSQFSFIGSGTGNTNQSYYSFIGSGENNVIQPNSPHSTIAGGWLNIIESNSVVSTIGGGSANRVAGNSEGTISGGNDNLIEPGTGGATIGGGSGNKIHTNAYGGAINGGRGNEIQQSSVDASIGGGFVNTANGSGATVSGGQFNLASSQNAAVGGGYANTNLGPRATIAGGELNFNGSDLAFIGGGSNNMILSGASGATISGGIGNTNNGIYATVAGGLQNYTGPYGTVGGGFFNNAGDDGGTIAGGSGNVVTGVGGTIGGGTFNLVFGSEGMVGGGDGNRNQGYATVIAGGYENRIIVAGYGNFQSTIGGGYANIIQGESAGSTISGGYQNSNNWYYTTIGGGAFNQIQSNSMSATISGGSYNLILSNAPSAAIAGGTSNTTSGAFATILGGALNLAAADYSFAAGQRAKATNQGSFVWADSQAADFASTTNDQFNIRARGGVRINEDTSLYFGMGAGRQMVNLWGTQYGIGVQSYTTYFRTDNSFPGGDFAWYQGGVHSNNKLDAGGGKTLMVLDNLGNLRVTNNVFAAGVMLTSDRNAKENFTPIEPGSVLAKVVSLPITRWNFKQDSATPHIGPMAQDFHAAFELGTDDKHIAVVDEGGVALAAIQGLNEKVEDRSRRSEDKIQRLEAENAELKQRLEKLERLMERKSSVAADVSPR